MKDLSTGLKNILGVGLKPGSYLNILYLLLAFPLGIFYFAYLITGFSIGLGLLYIFIGLPFLLLTMFSWRIFARFEGFQARWLLKRPSRPTGRLGGPKPTASGIGSPPGSPANIPGRGWFICY